MGEVFLDLGFIQIYWYSFFIFLGLLFGGTSAIREARRFDISEEFMINLFFYMIPVALIGARLYYVLFNFEYYMLNKLEIFQVWRGGLAIHGGIIFGFIWLLIYSHKYKINKANLIDVMAPGLLLGQAIGRWGNFFNKEAHGAETTIEFLQKLNIPNFIVEGMYINGTYYHPTFLYESLWCVIGFIIVIIIRRLKYAKTGQPIAFYLIWYGLGRFFIESMRTDSLMMGNFKVAQLVSIVMIIIGTIIFIVRKKESIFDNLYNQGGGNYETRV